MAAARTALLLSALAAIAALSASYDPRVVDEWNRFKESHGKSYDTPEEEEMRFNVFRENLMSAEILGREMPTATFGVTRYSDLTPEEFSNRFLSFRADAEVPRSRLEEDLPAQAGKRWAELPTSYTSPWAPDVVDNGASCGDCWAAVAAGVVSAAWQRSGNARVSFSRQQLKECVAASHGCSGGSFYAALQYVVGLSKDGGGLQTELSYPYSTSGALAACSYDKTKAVGKLDHYFNVQWLDESNMDAQVWKFGPVAVAIDGSLLQSYTSGILQDAAGCRKSANHAALLVGWGIEGTSKYWLLQNDWGSTFASGGRFKLARGSNACLLNAWSAAGAVAAVGSPVALNSSSDIPVADPCVPSKGCGSRVCGTADNGCGATLLCGTCPLDQTCTAAGVCISDGNAGVSDWGQIFPAGATNDFAVTKEGNVTKISYAGSSSSSEKRLSWLPSANWLSPSWSSLSMSITSNGVGKFGLGMRLGQTTNAGDCVYWRLTTAEKANLAKLHLCQIYKKKSSCKEFSDKIAWTKGVETNFTVVFSLNGGQSRVVSVPYINGAAVLGDKYASVEGSKFPTTGGVVVVAAGSGQVVFSAPSLVTKTEIHMTMLYCMVPSELASHMARALALPLKYVVEFTGTDPEALCDFGTKRAGEPMYSIFTFTLLDAEEVQELGGSVPLHTIPGKTRSVVLAQRMQDMIAEGALKNIGVVVTSVSKVSPLLVGIEVAVAFAAAISAGIIVLIVLLGCAGTTAVVVAGGGAVVYVATRTESPKPVDEIEAPKVHSRNPLRRTLHRITRAGVDVLGLHGHKDGGHQSITARGPARAPDAKTAAESNRVSPPPPHSSPSPRRPRP